MAMPRHVKDARIESREARRKLAVQSEPHWRAIVQGAHVGYYKGARRGAWLVRWRKPEGGYQKATLGEADDIRDADRVNVLSYPQAQQKALAQITSWQQPPGDDGEAAAGRAWTVADAVAAYERWLAKHRKPTAVRDLRAANRAHIEGPLGKVELAKLTPMKLRHWHEGLAEKPRRLRTAKGAKEQRYRPIADDPESIRRRRDTANRIRTILFAALNRAFEDGKVASDSAWRKVKPFRETGSARVRYLSLDECKRLMNACDQEFRKLVRGALVTGSRYGELCRADVGDFNADASTLLIRESKGGTPRWVALDDAGAAFLAAITAGRPPSAPLFGRGDGERWGPSHQTRPLQAACAAAKLEPCGFHTLRHTYASHRVMAGMPLIAVANVLGHSDTRMVEKHYGHLSPSYIREAVRATALDLGPHEAGNVTVLRPAAG
jgi:integrase